MPTSLRTAWLLWGTNRFLIGCEACSTGENLCLGPLTWSNSMDQEVLRPKGKPATVVLLNGRVVKLPSKNLFYEPVLFSSLISEASFCSGPWLMQKLMPG